MTGVALMRRVFAVCLALADTTKTPEPSCNKDSALQETRSLTATDQELAATAEEGKRERLGLQASASLSASLGRAQEKETSKRRRRAETSGAAFDARHKRRSGQGQDVLASRVFCLSRQAVKP